MQLRFIASSIVTAAIMFAPAGLLAQVFQKPIHLEHAIQNKSFYLLSAIENNSKVSTALLSDKELQEIGAEHAISQSRAAILQGRRVLHDEESSLDGGGDSHRLVRS